MRKRLIILTLLVLVWTPLVWAIAFNPGAYPLVYRSSASALATPTAGSGVIYGGISALVACEFYNSGAAAEYMTVYDSKTVAGQTANNIICATQCAGASFCSCSGPEPAGPGINGAIVTSSGLSWGDSKAYPGPTGSPDPQAQAICTYLVAQ